MASSTTTHLVSAEDLLHDSVDEEVIEADLNDDDYHKLCTLDSQWWGKSIQIGGNDTPQVEATPPSMPPHPPRFHKHQCFRKCHTLLSWKYTFWLNGTPCRTRSYRCSTNALQVFTSTDKSSINLSTEQKWYCTMQNHIRHWCNKDMTSSWSSHTCPTRFCPLIRTHSLTSCWIQNKYISATHLMNTQYHSTRKTMTWTYLKRISPSSFRSNHGLRQFVLWT